MQSMLNGSKEKILCEGISLISLYIFVYMFVFTYHWVCAKQFEQDPKPLYEAAKELINMQLESGLFPQQVTAFLKKNRFTIYEKMVCPKLEMLEIGHKWVHPNQIAKFFYYH